MAKAKFNPRRLLLVHAHPDDESLFTGHVIAKAVADGAEVFLLTLTRGERGHMKLEDLKSIEGNLPAMGAFRASELRTALGAYGKVQHKFAGTRAYLDSGFRVTAMGSPAKPKNLDELALSAAAVAVPAADIFEVLKAFKPDAVVTYNRKGGFGHPDHKMAHEATAMALRWWAKAKRGRVPEFWVIAEKGESYDVQVGDDKTALVKRAALEAHGSQVAVFQETYSIVNGKEIRYDAPERLRRASIRPMRWLKPLVLGLWALPLGILLGVAGTLLHGTQTTSHVHIGIYVALTMVASLAIGLRLLRRSRGALYLMTLGLLSTVFYLGQRRPDGHIFIGDTTYGQLWAYGSMIICALVMVFPRVAPGSWRRGGLGHR